MAREQLGEIINLTLPGGTVVQAHENSALHYAYARMGATPAPAGVSPDAWPGAIDDADLDAKTAALLGKTSATSAALRAATDAPAKAKLAALRPFHRALALRRTSPCDVLWVGHSFVQGSGGSGVVDADVRAVDTSRDTLRTLAPTPGVVGGRGSFAANNSVNSGYPVVNTGSFTLSSNYGIGRRAWQFTGSVTLTATFTGTGCDIMWTRNTGLGSFSYTVDGGAATTVTATGALAPGQVAQIRGLAAGSHTVVVSVASGTVLVESFMFYNGDESAGIRVWNGGKGSQQTADFIGAPNWYASIAPIQPDLVVLACMANNYGGSAYTPINPATTKTQLQQMIASIRAQCTLLPSTVLVIEYPRQDVTNNVAPWSEYARIAQEIADEDTAGPGGTSLVTIYDMRTRFGDPPSLLGATGLVGSDNVHPTEAGHRLWGDSLARFVLPA